MEDVKIMPTSAPRLSRAVNVDETLQVVAALCEKHAISISAIEPLKSGGTRVILSTISHADNLRGRLKGKLIEGAVVRSSLHVIRQPIPYD